MYSLEKYNSLHRLSEIQVSYKNRVKKQDRIKITASKDIVPYFRDYLKDTIDHREHFLLVCLNRANEITGFSTVFIGGISGTVVDLRIIFQIALKVNASSILLLHNHPSGNIEPSKNDKHITNKLKHAGQIMEIPLFDHIIITRESYFSFNDNQLI